MTSARECQVSIPSSLESLPKRPQDTLAWNSNNISMLHHLSPFGFTPSSEDDELALEGWRKQIEAAQNPVTCDYLLLVEDDLLFQGLGFTLQFWASALLVAMRSGRVLIEIPWNTSWPSSLVAAGQPNQSTSARHEAPRWCEIPPYTLQCFYKHWTHCQAPSNDSLHEFPRTHHTRRDGTPKYPLLRSLPKEPPYLRMKLSWFKVSALGWVRGNAYHAALRYLTSPRPWIKRIGACIMRSHGLSKHKFISLFVRDSIEKRVELAAHAHGMPQQEEYEWLTLRLADALGFRSVHLQTSSAVSAQAFSDFAARSNLSVVMTDNFRSVHDTWGGWGGRNESASSQTAASVVNQYIASQAAVYIGLSSSAWTPFIRHVMEGEGSDGIRSAPRLIVLCCSCKRGDRYYGQPITNLSVNVEVNEPIGQSEMHVCSGARRCLNLEEPCLHV